MRFRRSDLPGLLLATLAPALLFYLFLVAFEAWHHHGTPLLGFMSVNLAVGAGLLAALSRFVYRWDVPVALIAVIAFCVLGVLWAQRTGNDGSGLATGLKWLAIVAFLVLNAAIGLQVLQNALLPVLDRRDRRRAAEQAAAAE